VKERPILFSAPMVRAILEGRKSQTRRVVKHGQVFRFVPGGELSREERLAMYASPFKWDHSNPVHPTVDELLSCCPYGVPGDRLWVRETWSPGPGGIGFVYFADCPEGQHPPAWKPSIHMPRAACRITLEVVGVRTERLQEISEADAKAEGVTVYDGGVCYRDGYAALWDQINGPGSWAANPWVWVVEVKRLEDSNGKG